MLRHHVIAPPALTEVTRWAAGLSTPANLPTGVQIPLRQAGPSRCLPGDRPGGRQGGPALRGPPADRQWVRRGCASRPRAVTPKVSPGLPLPVPRARNGRPRYRSGRPSRAPAPSTGSGTQRVQACTDVAAEFGPIERTQPIGGGLQGGGGPQLAVRPHLSVHRNPGRCGPRPQQLVETAQEIASDGGAAMAGRPEAGEIHAAGDAGGRRGTLDLVPVGPVRRHVLRRLHPAGPVKGLERHICDVPLQPRGCRTPPSGGPP